jgi:hypothetical protein
MADPTDDDSAAAAATPAEDDTPAPAGDDTSAPAGDHTVRDELPEDLQPSAFVGPYMFPNNNRRRIPGILYLILAAVCVVIYVAAGDDSVLVNPGYLVAAGILAIAGVYHLVSGWNLDVDERDALVAATSAVGFPVGHASAQMGWRGVLSRPTWRILLYSAEMPPAQRGFVMVDGVDGQVLDYFTEENPEDWTDLVDQ